MPDAPWDCHICLHWGGLGGQCRQSHGVYGHLLSGCAPEEVVGVLVLPKQQLAHEKQHVWPPMSRTT